MHSGPALQRGLFLVPGVRRGANSDIILSFKERENILSFIERKTIHPLMFSLKESFLSFAKRRCSSVPNVPFV